MLSINDIHPLTDFLRNHKAHISRIKETGIPEVLTINGKAELVVMDATAFQALLDKVERAETIEAIREGLAAAERGEMKPAEQVFEEMRRKYGLHR
jgi:PHD/YefM family antitoxin component YafN of YafNO toxin-antitoxin module